MTFDHLRYFLAVAEHKSFSRAADALFISQSSLSKQIKSLETELKQQLFVRHSTQIVLTVSGKMFLTFAEKVLANYHDFLNKLPFDDADDIYTLRIGALPLMLDYGFMEPLFAFQKNRANVRFTLSEDNQLDLKKRIDNHQLDAVIARADYVPLDEYETLIINRDVISVACSEEHAFAQSKSLSLEEMHQENLAVLDEKSDLSRLMHEAFAKEGIEPKILFTCNRHNHLLGMLENNSDLITLLPSKLVNKKIAPTLVTIPLKEAIPTTIALIRRKDENTHLDELFSWWSKLGPTEVRMS